MWDINYNNNSNSNLATVLVDDHNTTDSNNTQFCGFHHISGFWRDNLIPCTNNNSKYRRRVDNII